MNINIVYGAMYLPCIYEGNWMTMSLHKSKEGANKAVLQSQMEEYKQHVLLCKHMNRDGDLIEKEAKDLDDYIKNSRDKDMKDWDIKKFKINN